MNNKENKFTLQYWFPDRSTKVLFETATVYPDIDLITACMVFAVNQDMDSVVIAKPKRGWGLPGGHLELGETPIECAQREFYEETNISVKNLKLIGYHEVEKIIQSEYNQKYPDIGYILMYAAQIDKIDDFSGGFETTGRAIVKFEYLNKYVDESHVNFHEVSKYAISYLKLKALNT